METLLFHRAVKKGRSRVFAINFASCLKMKHPELHQSRNKGGLYPIDFLCYCRSGILSSPAQLEVFCEFLRFRYILFFQSFLKVSLGFLTCLILRQSTPAEIFKAAEGQSIFKEGIMY